MCQTTGIPIVRYHRPECSVGFQVADKKGQQQRSLGEKENAEVMWRV